MSEKELPTNQQLSKQYFAVISQSAASLDTYMSIKELIAKCPVEIAELYVANGSLKDLKVARIGAKTKLILEAILAEGFTNARSKHAEAKELTIQKQFFGSSNRLFETDPNQEDMKIEHENAQALVHKKNEDLN